jgi:hypothetical protein
MKLMQECSKGRDNGDMVKAKYLGLCETCDHTDVCTLQRSPRLEIIQCERFSTQPVMSAGASARQRRSPSGNAEPCDLSGDVKEVFPVESM